MITRTGILSSRCTSTLTPAIFAAASLPSDVPGLLLGAGVDVLGLLW